MTGETLEFFLLRDWPPQNLRQCCGRFRIMSNRQIKTINLPVKANPALIENSVTIKDIGLACVSKSERPLNRNGDSVLSIASRIDLMTVLPLYPYYVRAIAIAQIGMLQKDLALFRLC